MLFATSRYLSSVSTVTARNAWHHDSLLCHKYEEKRLVDYESRLISRWKTVVQGNIYTCEKIAIMAYCWEKSYTVIYRVKKSHLQRFREENSYPDLILPLKSQMVNPLPAMQVKSLFNPWIH